MCSLHHKLLLAATIACCGCLSGLRAEDINQSAGVTFYYFNGERKCPLHLCADELDIVVDGAQGAPKELRELVVTKRLAQPASAPELKELARALARTEGVKSVRPVFYGSAAALRERRVQGRYGLPPRLVVKFRGDPAPLLRRYGLVVEKAVEWLPNTLILTAADGLSALAAANALYESGNVEFATPLFLKRRVARALPNDPLFPMQWHLYNSDRPGEDLHARLPDGSFVWDYFSGAGVRTAVVDDGLQAKHPDLAPNYDPGISYDFNFKDPDPTPSTKDDNHGTATAGLAGAAGGNGIGLASAAPNVTLGGLRLISLDADDETEAAALSFQKDRVDIYSNSWGPDDDGMTLEGPGPLLRAALALNVQTGRGGKGNLYVWAGGNGRENNDNSNYDGYANSRYTIAISASTDAGVVAKYSEPGANLVVNTPSGAVGFGGAKDIVTTDRTGKQGYNKGQELADQDYTNSFNGTSASCPMAAACIADLLTANSALTWRDVQHILIYSANKNDPQSPSWSRNGADLDVSSDYGFGRLSLRDAVAMARGWKPLPAQQENAANSESVALDLPDDDPNGIVRTLEIVPPGGGDLLVEHAEVTVDITHPFRGQLEITLVSPSGTESALATPHGDSGDDFSHWTFLSVRHWGERAAGTWTLKVADRKPDRRGTFNSWALYLYGRKLEGPQAAPTVTAAEPGTAAQGQYLSRVELRGSQFQPGALAKVSGGGVVLGDVEFLDASRLAVSLWVDADAEPGPRDVSVRNPDGSHATGSGILTIAANRPPNLGSGLVVTPTPARAGEPVSFLINANETDLGDTTRAFLDFGDGTVGRAPAFHIYRWPGDYTVQLVVLDSYGASASTAVHLTVVPGQAASDPPTVLAAVTALSGELPRRAEFAASATDRHNQSIQNLVMDFGDGAMDAFSGPGSVAHEYRRPGLYLAVVSATDAESNTGAKVLPVIVPAPGLPVPSNPVLAPEMLKAKLDFSRTGKDVLAFKGLLSLPQDFRGPSRDLRVYLAGLDRTFFFSKPGKAASTDGAKATVAFKRPKQGGVPEGLPARVTLKLSGDLRAELAKSGAADRDAQGEVLRDLPLAVILDGIAWVGKANLLYRAQAGKKGALSLSASSGAGTHK